MARTRAQTGVPVPHASLVCGRASEQKQGYGYLGKRASPDSPLENALLSAPTQATPHICDSIRGRPNSAHSEGAHAPACPTVTSARGCCGARPVPLLILKTTTVVTKWVNRALGSSGSMTRQNWAFSKEQSLVHPVLSSMPEKAPAKPGTEMPGPGLGSPSSPAGKRRSPLTPGCADVSRGQKTGVWAPGPLAILGGRWGHRRDVPCASFLCQLPPALWSQQTGSGFCTWRHFPKTSPSPLWE